MCGALPSIGNSEKPESALARELRDELGVDINPQALRIFIRSRWPTVSRLAHAIHGGEKA